MSLLKQSKKQKPRLKNSAKLPKLTIEQQIDNNEVIQRMNRKVTFTKNPRHLGSTITYQQAINMNNTNNDFNILSRQPTLLNTNNNNNTMNNNNNIIINNNNNNNDKPKFSCIPQSILFKHFQPHHTYQSVIKLVNKSNLTQRIKITPFSLKQFNIHSVQYPKQDSGDIAPGISVNITIRFRPINLNDLEEELIIIYNGGVIKVKIQAKRQKPKIQWPKQLIIGHCWVGNQIDKSLNIYNQGGQAQYQLVNKSHKYNKQQQQYDSNKQTKIGYFSIFPCILNFNKQSSIQVSIKFSPQTSGNFKQTIKFRSNQGQHQQIQIKLIGGSYNAQIIMQSINGQIIKNHQVIQNNIYLNGTQVDKISTGMFKLKNKAVVDVDYFWYVQNQHFRNKFNKNHQPILSISNQQGKLNSSSSKQFSISYLPEDRSPQNIKIQLYLYNLPQKSLINKNVVKQINGIKSIQCLILNIHTRPQQSNTNIYPLHKQIIDPIFTNVPRNDYFMIKNGSDSKRQYKISKISTSKYCQIQLLDQSTGIIQSKEQKRVNFQYKITQLSKQQQRCYFLVQFDNSPSKIFSVGGYVQYPQIRYSETQIYFGLCRTYTKITKQFSLKNQQTSSIQFKISNPIKYYELDFYDFYDFEYEENEQFKKKRFTIKNKLNQQIYEDNKMYTINPAEILNLELQYSTMSPQNIDQWFQIQVINGKTTKIPIIVTVQQILMQISRNQINLRQIYKGNVYNSNKFLSKQLSIQNKSNIQAAFDIIPPNQDTCLIKIQPMFCKIPPKSKKRIDVILEPIKTGNFYQQIKWRYFDDFKLHPQNYSDLNSFIKFNQQDGKKTIIKQETLIIKGQIKGVQIKYLIKDQSRARRVRQKIQDYATSVKYSSKSFKSSKASMLHDQQKLIYPFLETLNFYNCEINQVKQMQIIIENESDLSAQYTIEAQNYHTLQKVQAVKKNSRGLVGQQQQVFSSQMGKTFLQNRVLDKSQKVHLSNNKGISIMCDPPNGVLHKKQSQKILITMFNDTSGRFKDNLVISVKNHQVKKFPIDIHIKGTPVLLSRNQLGINFNQEIPVMNIGSLLTQNGTTKKTIKVVNKGPKQVNLQWKTYPYNQINQQKDLFKLDFLQGAPGTNDLVQVKWNALQPQIDKNSPFIIEPKQKTLKGREQVTFNLIVNQLTDDLKIYENLMICEPTLQDGQRKVKMENLAVVIQGEAVKPFLKMDLKHKNHINKLQLFATQHILKDKQTNSNNNFRKLKLTNQLKANLQFDISIISKDSTYQSFRIVSINSNSPINPYDGNKTFVKNKKYILAYQSFIEITVQVIANKKDIKQWPMEPRIRKEGKVLIKFSNGEEQVIQLVAWLYRPWVQIQMPNNILYSIQNKMIDFGVIHVKNSKKMSIYLVNPSKSDAKFTVTYIKYNESKPIQFQKALWTNQDYEDLNITDSKDCFFLSQDQGTVLNCSIPVHYIPGTLALPSQDDEYSATHKPIKVDFLFKPKSNLLYKSKFRITFQDSIFYDIIVKGKGTFDQQMMIK